MVNGNHRCVMSLAVVVLQPVKMLFEFYPQLLTATALTAAVIRNRARNFWIHCVLRHSSVPAFRELDASSERIFHAVDHDYSGPRVALAEFTIFDRKGSWYEISCSAHFVPVCNADPGQFTACCGGIKPPSHPLC